MQFADLLQRFAAAALVKSEDVDRGIRACLPAGKQCGGYTIAVEKLHQQRIGNFWLDSLNFKRETVTTGWRVDVLRVIRQGVLARQGRGKRMTLAPHKAPARLRATFQRTARSAAKLV